MIRQINAFRVIRKELLVIKINNDDLTLIEYEIGTIQEIVQALNDYLKDKKLKVERFMNEPQSSNIDVINE
jgi:hypothetical protein